MELNSKDPTGALEFLSNFSFFYSITTIDWDTA